MNITENLKKPYWERRINSDNIAAPSKYADMGYYYPKGYAEIGVQYLAQEDFLNELSPQAHKVMSDFYSRRPIYEAVKDEKGKVKWKIKDYDQTEKVSLGLPECISIKKASHFGDFWVANETTKTKEYDTLMSYLDSSGLKVAYMEAVLAALQTGDSAIYCYRRGNNIDYQVFSIQNGDKLYPQIDEERKPVMFRKYQLNGRTAVDRITTKYYETWVQYDEDTDDGKTWLNKIAGWIRKPKSAETSEDGYRLISRTEAQVSQDFNQVTYFRVRDVAWGAAISSIEAREKALSFVAEDVKSSAFPDLFIKATKISALPQMGSHSRVIAAKGTAEEIAHADAKTIPAGNMSNIAVEHLKELEKDILRSTMTVMIEPEILRSGADSSTTIKIMFAPEIQWCMTMWTQFYRPVRDMVEVFKQLVGGIEGNISDYADLRVSVGNEVWIPQNDKEKTDIATAKVYAGILSEKNARNELGSQYLDDYEQTKREREEDLYRKNYIPTQAKAEAEQKYGAAVTEDVVVEEGGNPNEPATGSATQKIDNRATRKSVATQRD